jgi:hypothetical protein
MTDHPRFKPSESAPTVAHRDYHGAPLVDLVFRLVDWWWPQTSAGQRRAAAREAGRRTVDAQERRQAAARLSYLRRRVGGLRA